jgi:hypothetical protein
MQRDGVVEEMSFFSQIEMFPLVFVRPSLLVLQRDSEAGDGSDTQGKHLNARAR